MCHGRACHPRPLTHGQAERGTPRHPAKGGAAAHAEPDMGSPPQDTVYNLNKDPDGDREDTTTAGDAERHKVQQPSSDTGNKRPERDVPRDATPQTTCTRDPGYSLAITHPDDPTMALGVGAHRPRAEARSNGETRPLQNPRANAETGA